MPDRKIQAHFIQPMLLLRTEALPTGQNWVYELKFDGFRAEAVKSGGKIHLRSRNDKDFNGRYPSIVRALTAMPDETVIDGEICALDESGRSSFNALQNYGTGSATLVYYVFDVMILASKDVMRQSRPMHGGICCERRCSPGSASRFRESPIFDTGLPRANPIRQSTGP